MYTPHCHIIILSRVKSGTITLGVTGVATGGVFGSKEAGRCATHVENIIGPRTNLGIYYVHKLVIYQQTDLYNELC